jgi:large subunit ribosomal protein L31
MKEGIHPTYYPKSKVKCACGESFVVGSTKPELHIEICSKCHPFYTGKEKLLDIAGKVEKFKARLRVAEARSGEAKARGKKARVKKQKKS